MNSIGQVRVAPVYFGGPSSGGPDPMPSVEAAEEKIKRLYPDSPKRRVILMDFEIAKLKQTICNYIEYGRSLSGSRFTRSPETEKKRDELYRLEQKQRKLIAKLPATIRQKLDQTI